MCLVLLTLATDYVAIPLLLLMRCVSDGCCWCRVARVWLEPVLLLTPPVYIFLATIDMYMQDIYMYVYGMGIMKMS